MNWFLYAMSATQTKTVLVASTTTAAAVATTVVTIQLVFRVIERVSDGWWRCVETAHLTPSTRKGRRNIYFAWYFTSRMFMCASMQSQCYLRDFCKVIRRHLSSVRQKLISFRLTAHEHDAYHLFLCWVDVLFKCMRVDAAPFKFIVRWGRPSSTNQPTTTTTNQKEAEEE